MAITSFRIIPTIAIGGLLAWGAAFARADDEALIFTPPGFDRPGMPAKATGADVGHVEVVVLDPETGKPTPCRINVVGPDGNFYQPAENPLSLYSLTGEWPKQGKGNRPGKGPFRYFGRFFYSAGSTTVDVPMGTVRVEVWKGFEFRPLVQTITVEAGQTRRVTLTLARSQAGRDRLRLGRYPPPLYRAQRKATTTRSSPSSDAEDIHYGFTLGYNDPPGPYKAERADARIPPATRLGCPLGHVARGYHVVSGQEYRSSTYGHLNLYYRDDLVNEGQSYNANDWPAYGLVGRENAKERRVRHPRARRLRARRSTPTQCKGC